MKQLKLLWLNPSNFACDLIEEIINFGHKVDVLQAEENLESYTYDFIFSQNENLSTKLSSHGNLLKIFEIHTFGAMEDEVKLKAVSIYGSNDDLMLNVFNNEDSVDIKDEIIYWLQCLAREEKLPNIDKSLSFNKLKIKNSSLNLLSKYLRALSFEKFIVTGVCGQASLGSFNASEKNDLDEESSLVLLDYKKNHDGSYQSYSTLGIEKRLDQIILTHVCLTDRDINFLSRFEGFLVNSEEQFTEAEYIKSLFQHIAQDASGQTILDIIGELALKEPDKIAIEDSNCSISYKELVFEIKNRAKCLHQLHQGKNVPVAINMVKSCDLVVNILAIIASGAYYVPIDPRYPDLKKKKIAINSQPNFILIDDEPKDGKWLPQDVMSLRPSDMKANVARAIDSLPEDTKNLAYLIYTSGTTGAPKGVMIKQESIINLARAVKTECYLDNNDRVLSIASIGFDAFGWDVYGSLLNGATLVLAPDNIQTDITKLKAFLIKKAISFVTLTPAVADILPNDKALALEKMVIMGDKPGYDLLNRWESKLIVMNGYGPTEATIGASINKYQNGDYNVSIGKPFPKYEFVIVNKQNQILPQGYVGELLIGGVGVAQGYFNQPSLSEEKFIDLEIFTGQKHRFYKTGDLVCHSKKGDYLFIGRKDHQIKIRGIRIELFEVEEAIRAYDVVEEVVVSCESDEAGGNKELHAYIKIRGVIDLNVLKNHLQKSLLPAAIPQRFFKVEEFKVNHNGKIDRKNIIVQNEIKLSSYGAPVGDTEISVFRIFSEMLRHDNFGREESFFFIGGHSLLAMSVISKINSKFETNIPVHVIFDNSSVKKLASLIPQYIGSERHIMRQLKRHGPLNYAQDRLAYLHNLDPSDVSYNLLYAVDFVGNLSKDTLVKSINYVINRHEPLRTIFGFDKFFIQKVIGESKNTLEFIENPTNIQQLLADFCYHPFDLNNLPPCRFCLIKIADDKHVFAAIMHNIITDAWSFGLFYQDLINCYKALISGNEPTLPDIKLQNVDVSQHEKKFRVKEKLQDELQYWQDKLLQHQVLDFPKKINSSRISKAGHTISYNFSKDGWNSLKQIAKEKHSTGFNCLIACINMWLSKYCNQNDILIGSAFADRKEDSKKGIMGFFVNTLPLRTKFNDNENFIEILERTTVTCQEANKNQEVPFEWIVDTTKAERLEGVNPLFQMMVILQNNDEMALPDVEGLDVSCRQFAPKYSMFDSVWNFQDSDECLTLELTFMEDLFEKETLQSYLKSLDFFIGSLSQSPKTPLAKLDVIDTEEVDRISSLLKGEQKELPNKTVVSQWLNICHQYPDNIAVQDKEGNYSYRYLLNESRRIANNVSYIKSGSGIGIVMQRGVKLVAAILGVLMSGRYYVPIDACLPQERKQYIVQDAGLDFVITDNKDLAIDNAAIINVADSSSFKCDNVTQFDIKDTDVAYILHTSGSTGAPKGVVINHSNLYNTISYFANLLKISMKDKLLSITTVSFDIFALEVFCPLLSGGKVYMTSNEVAANPVKLVNLINEVKPSLFQATPTMWRMIIDHLTHSKMQCLCGGESLDKDLANKLTKFDKAFNVYGPTETTIWSTTSRITKQELPSIGKSIWNTECYVLDKNNRVCPTNVVGELNIGGAGLARCYINNNEKTAESFRNVLIKNQKIKLYKTGDLAKICEDGQLYCLGRNDSQIKLRGHRIEILEIESAIAQIDFIESCAVKKWGKGNKAYLQAYITKIKNAPPLCGEELSTTIKNHLQNKLSAIMVPTSFVLCEELPKTDNGKIDRKSLVEYGHKSALNLQAYTPPETVNEIKIAKIWEEILQIGNISCDENFFVIGGNSIHIPQIVYKINEIYPVQLSIRNFILNSSIGELAKFIDKLIKNKPNLKRLS